MSCTINIKIKGKTYSIDSNLEQSEMNLQNIVKYLMNNGADTFSSVIEKLSKDDSISNNDNNKTMLNNLKEAFKGKNVIVGNYDMNSLRKRFPYINLDQKDENGNYLYNLDSNESIILSKQLRYEGVGLGGKVNLGSSNNSIFVISNQTDAIHLKNFLKARTILRKPDLVLPDISNNEQQALNYIKSQNTKLKDDSSALRYFFENSDSFLYDTVQGIDVYTTLNNYIKSKILEYNLRQEQKDPLVNSIIQRGVFNKSDFSYTISPNQLKNICKMFLDPADFSKIYIEETDNFKNTQDPDKKKELRKQQRDNIANFLNQRFEDSNLDFNLKSNGFLNITSPYQTIGDNNYQFSTVNAAILKYQDPQTGFKVFLWNNKYYISKNKVITSSTTLGKAYEDEKTAKNTLLKAKTKTRIYDGFNRVLIQFKPINGIEKISIEGFSPQKNTIIEVLDNYNGLSSEENLHDKIKDNEVCTKLLYGNINNLINYINENKGDSSVINSYEKAVAFIIELNNTNNINKAIEAVKNISTKQYLVLSREYHDGKTTLTITDNVETTSIDPNKDAIQFPMNKIINNLIEKINNKWKINNDDNLVVALNSNEDFKNNKIPNEISRKAKGFIYNGKIYINVTLATPETLVHELGHLMLGIIKCRNLNTYMNILDKMKYNNQVLHIVSELRQIPQYQNLADEDILEEAFVEYFSQRFSLLKWNTRKKDVFDNTVNKAFDDILKELDSAGNLKDVINNFSDNIYSYINQTSGLGFDVSLMKYRKVSNYISNKIGKGEIIMTC